MKQCGHKSDGAVPFRAAAAAPLLCFCFLAGSVVAPGPAVSAEPLRLTADRAVALAVERNETFLMAREDASKAAGVVKEAWAGALPNLSVEGTYQNNFQLPAFFAPEEFGGGKLEIGSDLEVEGRLRLDQVLYAFGRVGNAIRYAEVYERIAGLGVERARAAVVLEARSAYYGVLLAREVLSIRERSLEQAKSQLEETRRKHDQGTASRFDLLRTEVEVKNRLPERIAAENDLALAMQDLKRVVGLDGDPDPILTDTLFYRPFAIGEEEAVRDALARRPEILALEKNVEGQRRVLSIRKAERLPILGLYGQIALQGQADRWDVIEPFDENHRAVSSAAGIAVSMPIFDGFRTKGKVMQARADLRRAEYELEGARKAVRLETTKAVKDLESLRKSWEAETATVGLAEEAYRIAETRFRNGLSTRLELADAETALDAARTNYAKTLYDYDVALARLEKTIGRSLEEGDGSTAGDGRAERE